MRAVELKLTPEEADFIADLRLQKMKDRAFNAGIEAAARMAVSWADQCAGGSGEGGDGYRNLSRAILRLALPTPKPGDGNE